MNKWILPLLIVVILGAVAGKYLYFGERTNTEEKSIFDTGVSGKVLLGPTCPVVRIGDKSCEDRPYSTIVDVFKNGETKSIYSTFGAPKGLFHGELFPGNYILRARGGEILPRCRDIEVEVVMHKITDVVIYCDSGIR